GRRARRRPVRACGRGEGCSWRLLTVASVITVTTIERRERGLRHVRGPGSLTAQRRARRGGSAPGRGGGRPRGGGGRRRARGGLGWCAGRPARGRRRRPGRRRGPRGARRARGLARRPRRL